ncbi:MAG: DUF3551 domain-containing protein [Pseudolabrys sp.]|jgi:hypothetical protein
MRMVRFSALALAVLATPMLLLPSTARSYERPYDPYPWCAVYSGAMSGASNCGFLTWEQCMATVSGVGGFCEPNQFYNPGRRAPRHYRRHYRRYR